MDDVAAISALVYRYAELLDRGDLDGVAALFADAVWKSAQHPGGLRGVDAIRRVYDGVILYDGLPHTKHVITNLVIELAPDRATETATSRCSFTVLQARPDLPLQPILAGRYHDAFARRGDDAGSWRFTERTTIVDLTGDLSRHFRPSRL